jgi:DEAD/DEAH box helicase domain-containing protein
VTRPWTHQATAAEAVQAGRNVVVATGTASGKSLAYQLPILSGLLAAGPDGRDRALYLAPTKALAADQLRGLRSLNLAAVRAATYDGDTPIPERDWVRRHASYVLTNPDMLHRGMLPQHQRWRDFFRGLRWVVIDECHIYRGVFGSHVAQVLRRLRRVCALYGSHPVFVLASATTATPEESCRRLTGLDVEPVVEDGSPHGPLEFALWEPPLLQALTGENGAPVRRSITAETGSLLADLVADGVRSLAFVRSRRGAEVVAQTAARLVAEASPELVGRVAAYRGGYLAHDRRELERRLESGDLLGVAATNALELGVDVSGLDAVLVAGWPGTVASLWQQAGRAGRAGRAALAVFVARDDPLDTYLVHHPEAVFGRAVEATVLDPTNPYVLGPHLECAAAEIPLTEDDLVLFGGADVVAPLLADRVRTGVLRRRPAGWYWARATSRPDVDIRGTGGPPVNVVEAATGRLLGTVDAASAPSQVHTGAVHLHAGQTFLVDELDLEGGVALVGAADPDWTTHARDVTDIRVAEVLRSARYGGVELCFGTVEVTSQVVSFLRTRITTGEVLGEEALDLPARQLRTRAVWYALDDELLLSAGVLDDVPGAAHAAEHAAIGLLPLFATCDRWDIGGVSTNLHADTGRATVFVYDGHPGGAGFAERGHLRAAQWLGATRDAIRSCGCETGCPSCVQSPKCGNGNEPLDKAGAVRLLSAVLAEMAVPGAGTAGPARAG